jgi:uncharacterized protein (DUF2141 family)
MPEANKATATNNIFSKYNLWALTIIIGFLLKACAAIVPPGGGPKDEDPPKVLKTVPVQNSLNYKGKIVEIVFDEPIKTDKLTQNLIISPNIKNKFKFSENKNKLSIKFEDEFPPNTTISLNFRETIKDLNEGNVLKDFVLAFSTGDKIDTLKLQGTVEDLLLKKPINDVLVTLHKTSDTLDIKKHLPDYITKTDKTGEFKLNNIHPGRYHVAAYIDANSNLKYDNKTEKLAFLSNTLVLLSDTSVKLSLAFHDDEAPKIQKNLAATPGNNLYLSEGIDTVSIMFQTLKRALPIEYDAAEKLIKIYNTQNIKDSIEAVVTMRDSVYNISTDTLFLKFSNMKDTADGETKSVSKTKKTKQTLLKSNPSSKSQLATGKDIELIFPYLPLGLMPTSFYISIDSADYQPLKSIQHIPFLKSAIIPTNNLNFKKSLQIITIGKSISLINDSVLSNDTLSFTFKDPADFSRISGKVINTQNLPLVIELLSEAGKVVDKQKLVNNSFSFLFLNPGKYQIRVILDSNANGRWDSGKLKLRQQPEKVFLSTEIITLKAGWEIEDIVVKPSFD